MAEAKGVTVVSPTWFFLNDGEGGFDNASSAAYVEQAHAMGLEVWALVNNMDNEIYGDEIKAVMNEQATEEMTVDTHIVRWTTTLSNRFDTTTFKKEHNEMYKQYTKQTTSRRFSIT